MKKHLQTTIVILIFFSTQILSQQTVFDTGAYSEFLGANKNMSAEELTARHNTGYFSEQISGNVNDALYLDSLKDFYNLTDDELSLIAKNGFVVTERVNDYNFLQFYTDIYRNDYPVFVSTDAILHAIHKSYVEILRTVEKEYLAGEVESLLEQMHLALPSLKEEYSGNDVMQKSVNDVDVYITVGRKLFDDTVNPLYAENGETVETIMTAIEMENIKTLLFFADSTFRRLDFSQFKPRGHYAGDELLEKYFRVMMWLGRTEIYLSAPEGVFEEDPFYPKPDDLKRQAIDAMLIKEIIDENGLYDKYETIEKIVAFFVGEQDNVTLDNLNTLYELTGLETPDELLDDDTFSNFKSVLGKQPFSDQKILSQLLMRNPFQPDSIEPASAFMLFGQRFVIDSYITGSVVYDRVSTYRMLPSTLDILFALGNDAAGQLLKPELERYKYASNLAGLRYLVDTYGQDFWDMSVYNLWLDSIRKLNPPAERNSLPEFMRTAAWWQQKMNGQLAGWTELRHDNLLYAKQSYTGMTTCSFPYSYVEPVPEFYEAVKNYAEKAKEGFGALPLDDVLGEQNLNDYFTLLAGVMDTLGSISVKELENTELTPEETLFLKSMIQVDQQMTCGSRTEGWYPKLYYYPSFEFQPEVDFDYIVADYHTTPTDEWGALVGWISHAGTGPVDLMITVADLPGGGKTAFAGPVASYHEYRTDNFYRLTDQEWEVEYLNKSSRPEWTNIYIADENGNKKPEAIALITSVEENGGVINKDISHIIARNYPNPFNPSTKISFTIPYNLTGEHVKLNVYNIRGELVSTLVNEQLSAGNYIVSWNGTYSSGGPAASGVYIYEVRAGGKQFAGKMTLLK